jgi:hypothetical protein
VGTFIHVNDIKSQTGNESLYINTNAVDINTNAVDFLQERLGGQDTELTLRSGRVIRVMQPLSSLQQFFPKSPAALPNTGGVSSPSTTPAVLDMHRSRRTHVDNLVHP